MAAVPNYADDTSASGTVRISTANSARDGSGTIGTAIVEGLIAGDHGTNLSMLSAKATGGIATDSCIVVYQWNATTSAYNPIAEFKLTAVTTPSNILPSAYGELVFATTTIPGRTIPTGSKIAFSATVVPSGGAIAVNWQAAHY